MLGEIVLERVDNLEIISKEERNFGKLNIFFNKRLIDSKEIDVEWIVYLKYSKKNNLLIGSGYNNGQVFSISISNNKFMDNLNIIDEVDSGNKKSRSHSIVMDKRERYAYSANIGLDKIYIYEICSDKLKLVGDYKLPDGCGPRHITFNKRLDVMYVITENSNEIFAFEQNNFTGHIRLVEQISILPYNFSGISYGQTLVVQEDNKFLFANNRGANTVAVFEILDDGKINKITDLDHNLFDFYKTEENIYGI